MQAGLDGAHLGANALDLQAHLLGLSTYLLDFLLQSQLGLA